MSWYLRSLADHDTHRADGVRADGTVHAECGARFTPKPSWLGTSSGFIDGPPELPLPPIPEQVCPACEQKAASR